jgi:hypothetical protein
MNTMMFGFSVSSFMIALRRSSNWPAVLGAGDDQRDVEREDALVGEEVRHVAEDDLLRQALDDGGLADARLADQHGVVLGPAAEHLLDALEPRGPGDERIELDFEPRRR